MEHNNINHINDNITRQQILIIVIVTLSSIPLMILFIANIDNISSNVIVKSFLILLSSILHFAMLIIIPVIVDYIISIKCENNNLLNVNCVSIDIECAPIGSK